MCNHSSISKLLCSNHPQPYVEFSDNGKYNHFLVCVCMQPFFDQ